jgi:hypothetical protein
MILKTSTLAVCSTSNLPTFVWPFGPASAPIAAAGSPCPPSNPGRPRRCARSASLSEVPWQRQQGARQYATAHHRSQWNPADDDWSPLRWPTSPNPTPYQILNQKRSAPYSKACFYELVKLYHPDRNGQILSGVMSDSTRLERYRLVVAANEILSNPAKRRAYDLYGAGWGRVRSMDASSTREADRNWRKRPGNPSMNATWEDWERWHAERDGTASKQQALYMSNEMFVLALCAVVIIISIAHGKTANTTATHLKEMQDERHWAIRYDMARRGTEMYGLTRHERIETFLRQRDGWDFSAASTSHHSHSPEDK